MIDVIASADDYAIWSSKTSTLIFAITYFHCCHFHFLKYLTYAITANGNKNTALIVMPKKMFIAYGITKMRMNNATNKSITNAKKVHWHNTYEKSSSLKLSTIDLKLSTISSNILIPFCKSK